MLVGYPSKAEEFVVVERMTSGLPATARVLDAQLLQRYQSEADSVYVDPAITEYAVELASATRDPSAVGRDDLARYLTWGASPRASINLVLAGRALAYLRGRDHVVPADVHELAHDVLRHRLVLSYEALAEDLGPDDLLDPILGAVPVPTTPLKESRPASVRGDHRSVVSGEYLEPGAGSEGPWTRPPR